MRQLRELEVSRALERLEVLTATAVFSCEIDPIGCTLEGAIAAAVRDIRHLVGRGEV